MAMLAVCWLTACSNNDNSDLPEDFEQKELTPLYSDADLAYYYYANNRHVESLGDWSVCKDNEGHYWWAIFYDDKKPIEKMYACPTSIDGLNGILFRLDENHSLKLGNVEHFTDWEGFSRREEFYHEYYRGVHVFNGKYLFHFIYNSQEQYIHHCNGLILTFDNLDVTPDITGEQALQIFSDYLKKPIENSWSASLYAREYHIKQESGTFRREQRLVYYVKGPAARHEIDWGLYDMSANEIAEIDAHTGQIIYVGNSDLIPD